MLLASLKGNASPKVACQVTLEGEHGARHGDAATGSMQMWCREARLLGSQQPAIVGVEGLVHSVDIKHAPFQVPGAYCVVDGRGIQRKAGTR